VKGVPQDMDDVELASLPEDFDSPESRPLGKVVALTLFRECWPELVAWTVRLN
jgi:hypothetical protein